MKPLIRKLALPLAGIAAAFLLTAAPALASPAHQASHAAPAPLVHAPAPVPSVHGLAGATPEYPPPPAGAAPASQCNSAGVCCQGATFYWADLDNQVDHWFTGGPWFTDPLISGYQTVCYVWVENQAPYYFQLMVWGGPAAGNCVTEEPQNGNPPPPDIRASGCAYHKTAEQFADTTGGEWVNASLGDSRCLEGLFPSGSGAWRMEVCDGNNDLEQQIRTYSA